MTAPQTANKPLSKNEDFQQLGSRALRAYLEADSYPRRTSHMAKTILIADDDPHIQDVISFALEREGYD